MNNTESGRMTLNDAEFEELLRIAYGHGNKRTGESGSRAEATDRKAVARAGGDVLNDTEVKDTMKTVVKNVAKEAVKEAVQ